MKVLVLGATGNVGSRLIPALLVHKHTPILYVRSPEKLAPHIVSAIPSEHIVIGSATDSGKIKQAILDQECDGVINAAGLAGVIYNTEAFPAIFKAVAEAAIEAGKQRGRPIRAWFLAGLTSMDMPPNVVGGRKELIMDYVPMFRDHRTNYELVKSVPATELSWSTLCASQMLPAKPSNPNATAAADGLDLAREARAQSSKVVGSADSPPDWASTLAWVPLIGGYLNAMANSLKYTTTLEQTTDFIAADLEKGLKSEFAAKRVAIIARS